MGPSVHFPGIRVQLAAYASEYRQAAHRHDELVLALNLRGSVREGVGTGEAVALPLMLGQKPPELSHTDHFGPAGGLALRIAVAPEQAQALPDLARWQRWTWWPAGPSLPALLRLAEAVARGDATAGLVSDALAAIHLPAPRAGRPPAWLARVRETLDDTVCRLSLAAVAREAQVHPVYLARAFRAWYGCSVVTWRRRRQVARAVSLLGAGESSLARAAADSGFYDQAALTHAFRREAGLTPSRFRQVLSAVPPPA